MQGMWDQVLLWELSGVGAVPFLCISSLLAAPKGVKGVKEEKYFSEAALRLWELALFFCLKMQPMLKQPNKKKKSQEVDQLILFSIECAFYLSIPVPGKAE